MAFDGTAFPTITIKNADDFALQEVFDFIVRRQWQRLQEVPAEFDGYFRPEVRKEMTYRAPAILGTRKRSFMWYCAVGELVGDRSYLEFTKSWMTLATRTREMVGVLISIHNNDGGLAYHTPETARRDWPGRWRVVAEKFELNTHAIPEVC